MAFAVICKSCQARFLLNDDLLRRRVAGRVVTVRCRQCHAAIEVDASNMDLKSSPQHEAPAAPRPTPATPVAALKTKTARPAPSPPRPAAKATLMGIGGPPKPQGAAEMVALSPGLLHMSVPATSPALSAQGFPEPPPPPPAAVEELDGDWEVTETPLMARAAAPSADAAPESLDDFAEELPPSLPPPEEEVPSSTGTPSLATLAHHQSKAARPRADEFLANMQGAMNGGVMDGGALGAPTIDVSTLDARARDSEPNEVDLSAFDVPLTGKQTLPLFTLSDDDKTPAPGIVGRATAAGITPTLARAPSPTPAPRRSEGSLSPAAVDQPSREAPRERKNVVAPATKSEPPTGSAQRRSGLAAPLLLAFAAAAGFLIWKRTSTPQNTSSATAPPTKNDTAAPPSPASVQPHSEPIASVGVVAPAAPVDEELTFESAPVKPTSAPAKPGAGSAEPGTTRVAEPKPTHSEPAAPASPAAPVTPVRKEEPKPAEPSTPAEPAGPFDRAAAAAALTAGASQASACRKEGDPSGVANVVITFAPSGRVTSATIGGPPFAGTPTGGCIAAALRKARVPPFEGERVTVSKTIVVQ